MSLHQREHTTIRTESAGIANARHSLDNVLSAKSNLEQTSSWQVEDPVDIGCALDLQIGELEGMLAEIMDERFARMMDESQQDDENENRNTGLLNFIIDTADNILASLLSTNDTPPPTYEKHRINVQSNSPTQLYSAHKPKFESSDVCFPLPTESRAESHSPGAIVSKNRNDKRRSSTNTLPPPIPSIPTKSTRNKLVGLGSSNPISSSPNPFRGRGFVKSQDDSSTTIDDLSFSAFHALQNSEAFKTLLNRSENKTTSDVDRDNLWFSFREAFGNNLSKELLCAFDILIRVSSNSERSAKEVDKSGLGDIDKGKTPLRSESPPPTSRSPSPFTDSDFVTIESPHNTQSQQKTTQSHNISTSLQPPPYAQHHYQTSGDG
ncbi:hypothetical protein Agabi119p4_11622 [Agaricus bisporus var. burnettii]|uniref:Uncharacterized protein n=1 Tax=Agaricus bisporus var. burnettii TaxID=192524 RepID=A0A8H7EVE3_AGABI|nr:hypothetical protein Agabi119p4_11622 [Agaricus bisporus var. burnettii]